LVRSTNGGLTAVVDIDGTVLKQFPVFTALADSVVVPIYTRTLTPYALLGDWIIAVFAIFLAFCIVITRRYT
ncbi:MAG TPA: apolipoprotein N-acyltransferase, partial [Spirochaetales bacterium]|nr:apolipoprotein N-acyltransferase [Spirochaetales bacterium]